jgi:hypothetical protein
MAIIDDFKEINKRVRTIAPHALGEKRKPCRACADIGWHSDPRPRTAWMVCVACNNPFDKPNPTKKI